jgi:hypothetical protein
MISVKLGWRGCRDRRYLSASAAINQGARALTRRRAKKPRSQGAKNSEFKEPIRRTPRSQEFKNSRIQDSRNRPPNLQHAPTPTRSPLADPFPRAPDTGTGTGTGTSPATCANRSRSAPGLGASRLLGFLAARLLLRVVEQGPPSLSDSPETGIPQFPFAGSDTLPDSGGFDR